MNRRLQIGLLTALLSAFGSSQIGPDYRIQSITEITPKGDRIKLADSHVIDTRTHLEVVIDAKGLFMDLATSEQKQRVSQKLEYLSKVLNLGLVGQDVISEALKIINETSLNPLSSERQFSVEQTARITSKLNGYVSSVIGVLEENSELETKISEAIRKARLADPENAVMASVAAISDTLIIEGSQIYSDLQAAGVRLRVHLRHFRDDDASRRYEVKALEPLTAADLAVIEKLRQAFPSDKITSVDDFVKSLVDGVKGELQQQATALKGLVDGNINAQKAKLDELKTKLGEAWGLVEGAKKQAKDRYDNFVKRVTDLQTKAEDLVSTIGKLQGQAPTNDLIQFTSKIRSDFESIASELKGLPIEAKSLWTDLTSLLLTTANEAEIQAKTIVAGLQSWVSDLPNVFKQTIIDATQMISKLSRNILQRLNFAAKMQQIGESFTDVNSPIVRLTNDEGKLGSLSDTLVSGDELLLNLQAMGQDDAVLKDYPSIRLYCYKIGTRSDRLITIGFFSKTEGSGLRYGIAVTDVFKMGTRKSLQANRLMSFGIGPSLAFLDQDGNDQQEFGIGLGASFLDDRLIGGYGYNIGLGRGYYWIGFRLPVRT
ncbi:MAG: hypothetical protein KF784_08820 [Fimbriimonadaceae bacterium]|nr:hypothetical protein [Fimbriimonadaceae bacterium]